MPHRGGPEDHRCCPMRPGRPLPDWPGDREATAQFLLVVMMTGQSAYFNSYVDIMTGAAGTSPASLAVIFNGYVAKKARAGLNVRRGPSAVCSNLPRGLERSMMYVHEVEGDRATPLTGAQ